MNYAKSLFLTQYSTGNLSIVIIAVSILIFSLLFKKKDRTVWTFVLIILAIIAFSIRNIVAQSAFTTQYSMMVEFFIILVFFIYFLFLPMSYFLYENIFHKESVIVMISCFALFAVSAVVYYFSLINSEPQYNFITLAFRYKGLIAIPGNMALLFLIISASVFSRKCIRYSEREGSRLKKILFPRGRKSIACRNFLIVEFLFLIMAVAGILTQAIGAEFNLFVFFQCVITLVSLFVLSIFYINSQERQVSMLIKIVGITYVFLLSIIGGVGLTAGENTYKEFDSLNLGELKFIKNNIQERTGENNIVIDKKTINQNITYIASKEIDWSTLKSNYKLLYTNGIYSNKSLNELENKLITKKIQTYIKTNLKKVKNTSTESRLDRAKELSYKQIKEEEFKNLQRKGKYLDKARTETFVFYYYFTINNKLYEIGYNYPYFRQQLHKNSKLPLYMSAATIVIFILIFPVFFRNSIIKPLDNLINGIRTVQGGSLDTKIPIMVHDEIGFVTNSFNSMVTSIKEAQDKLSEYSNTLEDKVSERTEELQCAMEELEAINNRLVEAQRIADLDMRMAINVQSSLFPKEAPALKDWELAFKYKPLTGVSGDMYEFYTNDNTLEGLVVADVSGHGIASALITMIARSVFFRNFNHNRHEDLNVVIDKISSDMINEIGNVDNYLTSILLRFKNNIVEYVNAAHTELLYKRADKGNVFHVKQNGNDIKGLFIGISDLRYPYKMMKFKMMKGDELLIYTDCIIENMNSEGIYYGEKRLLSAFEKSPSNSSQKTLDYILNDFYTFIGSEIISDDLTVVVCKYTGS